MRQGDGSGALQGSVDGQLAEAVVNAWHLTVHRPTGNDAHLRATTDNVTSVIKQLKLYETFHIEVRLQKVEHLSEVK